MGVLSLGSRDFCPPSRGHEGYAVVGLCIFWSLKAGGNVTSGEHSSPSISIVRSEGEGGGGGPDGPSPAVRTELLVLLMSPALLLWLTTLFRVLSSTASDYLSPSPEMLSRRLGLPPRFAGATLLALGNGAPNVSATVSAMSSDPRGGYRLSLGALTGAGMFVGTAVAGAVVLASGGVPCRGALVRDAASYGAALGVVYAFLGSGCAGSAASWTFFGLYGAYVATVLAADVYHRAVVIPRAARKGGAAERRRAAGGGGVRRRLGPGGGGREDGSGGRRGGRRGGGAAPMTTTAASGGPSRSRPMTITSAIPPPRRGDGGGGAGGSASNADAPDSGRSVARGGGGRLLSALSNYDPKSFRTDRTERLRGPGGVLDPRRRSDDRPSPRPPRRGDGESAPLAVSGDLDVPEEGGIWGSDGAAAVPPPSAGDDDGPGATLRDGARELRDHFGAVWDETFRDEDAGAVETLLRACELPFTILRKITVPVPCEGYYCRPLVALSLSLSPLWAALYARAQFDARLPMPCVAALCSSRVVGFGVWICSWELQLTMCTKRRAGYLRSR